MVEVSKSGGVSAGWNVLAKSFENARGQLLRVRGKGEAGTLSSPSERYCTTVGRIAKYTCRNNEVVESLRWFT
jgi:hypothetical protein